MPVWILMVACFLAGCGAPYLVRAVPDWLRELRMSYLFWRAMRRD